MHILLLISLEGYRILRRKIGGIMKDEPLVSVVITTYNRQKMLIRAIDSVLQQDYQNLEIIVSDDCSQYDLTSIINDVYKNSKFEIVYRRNKCNRGACFTRNEGIKLARGYFIAGLDDDDEFTKDRISYLVKSYKEIYSFVTSNTMVVSKTSSKPLFNTQKARVISFEDLLWENTVGTQVLVKKEIILDCGGFDSSLTSGQDADMWLNLTRRFGPCLRLPECKYLLHTEHEKERISTSNNKIAGFKTLARKYECYRTSSQNKYSSFKIHYGHNKLKLVSRLLVSFDFSIYIHILKRILKII
jgi:glycosyltransferase involved in cell wall biosynthesis